MNTKINILLIEDDKSICSYITASLSGNGYRVITALSGKEGVSLAASFRQLRSWSSISVIVISARVEEQDKVMALDLGADDYITKPFGPAELMARIRTSLRHSHSAMPGRVYRAAGLEIYFDKRMIYMEGSEVHLTQIEYQLLSLLAENSGRVLTYKFIMNTIWGPYTDGNNQILRVNMANIRRKIEKNPAQPQYVFTEIGIGYRMRENESV